jgi:hypothetical protein
MASVVFTRLASSGDLARRPDALLHLLALPHAVLEQMQVVGDVIFGQALQPADRVRAREYANV